MNIQEKIINRFQELEQQSFKVPSVGSRIDSEQFQQWATSAIHLIGVVFGKNSPHYSNFAGVYKRYIGVRSDFNEMRGIFLAAKDDYEGGYLFQAESVLSGEIFSSFVIAAKHALEDAYKDVAAVLACAALEDALKRFARLNGLHVEDKDMTEVVNSLKSAGLVSGAQKTLLDTMPKIRNYAMHAEWAKITQQDVGSVIGFVEQFILANF
jgi:hypothetical protein